MKLHIVHNVPETTTTIRTTTIGRFSELLDRINQNQLKENALHYFERGCFEIRSCGVHAAFKLLSSAVLKLGPIDILKT